VEATGTDYSWSGTGAPPASGYTCAVASGLTCDQATQKCIVLAATGQPCESDSDCVTADYCAFGSSTEQCAVRVADGASCAADPDACLTTSYCDTSSMTCTPLLPAGTACSTSEQCASLSCVNDVCGASNNLGLQLLCGTN
jgi:hypothetical protein